MDRPPGAAQTADAVECTGLLIVRSSSPGPGEPGDRRSHARRGRTASASSDDSAQRLPRLVPPVAIAVTSGPRARGLWWRRERRLGRARSLTLACRPPPPTPSPCRRCPGTLDASPTTPDQLSRGPRHEVTAVRVVGSHSGLHAGALRAYSTGTGESFLPGHGRSCQGSGLRSAPVSGRAETHRPAPRSRSPTRRRSSQKQFPLDPGSAAAVQHYSSAPSLTPSTLTITTAASPARAPATCSSLRTRADGTAGPMIAEQDGELVWFHPLPSRETATNFSVQQYEGKPVLVWWQGRVLELGFGQGEDEVYNTSYQHIAHDPRRQRLPGRPARDPADAAGRRLAGRLLPGRR